MCLANVCMLNDATRLLNPSGTNCITKGMMPPESEPVSQWKTGLRSSCNRTKMPPYSSAKSSSRKNW